MKLALNSHSFYVMIGTFALVFMAYLWIAPKLIKKPAGTPPRAGSNEEKKQIAKTIAGVPPAPTTDQKEGKAPASPLSPSGLPPMTQVMPKMIGGFGPLSASSTITGSGWRPHGAAAYLSNGGMSMGLYPFSGIHYA